MLVDKFERVVFVFAGM